MRYEYDIFTETGYKIWIWCYLLKNIMRYEYDIFIQTCYEKFEYDAIYWET